jgi:hypothetical protein
MILVAPQASAFLIRFVIGGVPVVNGVSDLWLKARGKEEGKIRGSLEAVIGIAALAPAGVQVEYAETQGIEYSEAEDETGTAMRGGD